MIRKARDMKMALEGEGHKYQHGKPRFLVIGASKGPEEEWLMVGEEVGYLSDSSGRDLTTDGYLTTDEYLTTNMRCTTIENVPRRHQEDPIITSMT
jgi:hypothetical protein